MKTRKERPAAVTPEVGWDPHHTGLRLPHGNRVELLESEANE
jgi:hypothetical protein